MLYEIFEMAKAANKPLNAFAQKTRELLDHEHIQKHPMGRYIAASNEMLERATRYFDRPEFGIKTCKTKHNEKEIIADIEEEVVFSKPFCDLLKFNRKLNGEKIRNYDKKILVVAPMSGHFSTLLRDTVDALLPNYNVFITDWKDAKMVPQKEDVFSSDQYVTYLIEILKHMGRNTHVLAVCQPSVPVMIAVSVLAKNDDLFQPLSMILMGGPIDTRINPGEVNKFALKHDIEWFKKNIITKVPNVYPGAGRSVCPGFLMLNNFIAMNPKSHQEAHHKHFLNLIKGDDSSSEKHRKFYDEYLAVMDLPAEYFLKSIQDIFQEFTLPRGTRKYRDELVQPELIKKTGLLTIEGDRDDITCPGQTKAAHPLCSNIPSEIKEHHLQKNTGHYGIFSGSRWRSQVLLEITAFIEKVDKYFKS